MTSSVHFNRPKIDMRPILHEFSRIRPYGGASLIYADPPWRFEDWSEKGDKSRSIEAQYETQSIDWIEQLPVDALAAKDCLLWLWATAPMLPQALGVVEAWGFVYKTSGVWVKRTKTGKTAFGTGRRLRSAHEPFILATRGAPRVSQAIRSVIGITLNDRDPFASLGITVEAMSREHSRKPDDAIEAARLCVDGPAVELFSRQRREGWVTWGNEPDKFGSGRDDAA